MGTQLDASIGLSVAESSFGAVTTPTKFPVFNEETFDANLTYTQANGYRVGNRFPISSLRALALQEANGDLTLDLVSKQMGSLFNAALGTVTTTQRGSTGVYQQNHTPTASDFLASYTIQKGVPILGSTTQAYTFPGSVCSGFELTVANGSVVTLKTSWVSQYCETSTAYATPSYVAENTVEVFTFVGAALKIGGTLTLPTTTALASSTATAAVNIRDLSLVYTNNLDSDGNNMGSAGKRSRPPAITGWNDPVTGTMTAEFDSTTLPAAFLNNTSLPLILTLSGGTVIGSGSDVPAVQITLPDARLTGEIPKVGGGGVVTVAAAFTGMFNGTDAPITVSYVSTDTAP